MGGGKKWFGSSLREQHAYVSCMTGDNGVGDEGATALASALETNSTLKDLNLSKMMIHVW